MTAKADAIDLTDILAAMESAAGSNEDLTLSSDPARQSHKVTGIADTLTVDWQDSTPQGDEAGWSWWLVTRDSETGDTTHEESGGLDSLKELSAILDNMF